MPDYAQLGLFIGGTWRDGSEGRFQDVIDPATEQVLGRLPQAGRADLDLALEAAAEGFAVWRDKAPEARAEVIQRTAALLRERADRIGAILTMEQGKPLAEAKAEVGRAAALIEWDANEGRRAYGRIIPSEPGLRQTVLRQPIGPVAAFTPWNFPAGSPARKMGAALAAGCSIIVKASEETPGTACEFARCFHDAGLPPGVLGLVFGVPAEISEHLIASPVIRLVTFTGSVPVGKHLAGLCAAQMKPAIMELGGHSPVIVCADSDPVAAGKTAALGKFRNAGQVCVSPTRFIVHESLHDRFVDSFAEVAGSLKVGNGLEDGVKMGPLANPRRLEAMAGFVSDAQAHGARVVTGGERIGNRGFFFKPTVLTDVPDEARVMQTEPFGPIAPVVRFGELDEAIARANALPYGLASYAFTESARTAAILADRVESGVMSINHVGGSQPDTPFGGVKESGYGREGGSESLDGYMVTKFVSHLTR